MATEDEKKNGENGETEEPAGDLHMTGSELWDGREPPRFREPDFSDIRKQIFAPVRIIIFVIFSVVVWVLFFMFHSGPKK